MTSGDKMEEAIQSKKSILLEYLKVIVITLIVTYGILYFVQISRVYGTSMIPTYHEGNIVLVDKVFYKNNQNVMILLLLIMLMLLKRKLILLNV